MAKQASATSTFPKLPAKEVNNSVADSQLE